MSTNNEIFDYVMDSPQDTNPAVLKSLLNDLEGGGGGGGGETLTGLIEGTVKEVTDEDVTTIRDYAFCKCEDLETAILPNATTVGTSAFQSCKKLKVVDLSNVTTANTSVFAGCIALEEISLPKLGAVSTAMFSGSTSLKVVDLGAATVVGVSSLSSCSSLDTIVLRSNTLCELEYGSTSTLSGTCFDSEGSGGTLYVPQALIDSYEAATGWSTIIGYTNNQILPIEGSQYE